MEWSRIKIKLLKLRCEKERRDTKESKKEAKGGKRVGRSNRKWKKVEVKKSGKEQEGVGRKGSQSYIHEKSMT